MCTVPFTLKKNLTLNFQNVEDGKYVPPRRAKKEKRAKRVLLIGEKRVNMT
jgi:hypothetical protein